MSDESLHYSVNLSVEVSQTEFDALETSFNYHAPTPAKLEQFEQVRQFAKLFAAVLLRSCPDCRERSEAIKSIEQAMMWANASIARSPD